MRPFALGALECLVGVAPESVRDLMTRVEGDALAEKVLVVVCKPTAGWRSAPT